MTESMDGTTKRTFEATLEATNQFQVTGTYFQQLLNGQHTMKMKAQDTGGEELGVHLALHEVGHGLFHHAGDAHGG